MYEGQRDQSRKVEFLFIYINVLLRAIFAREIIIFVLENSIYFLLEKITFPFAFFVRKINLSINNLST